METWATTGSADAPAVANDAAAGTSIASMTKATTLALRMGHLSTTVCPRPDDAPARSYALMPRGCGAQTAGRLSPIHRPAVLVYVAAVAVVRDDDREPLRHQPVDGFRAEVGKGDDFRAAHTAPQQGGGPFHRREVHRAETPDRVLDRGRAAAFSNHPAHAVLEQRRRIGIHAGGRRRSGGADRPPRTGRGGAAVVDDLAAEVDRQGIARGEQAGQTLVGRVARGVDDARQQHLIAGVKTLDLGARKRRRECPGSRIPGFAVRDCRRGAHKTACPARWEWQSRFTATGRLAMWVGCCSTCTARAVMRPPNPPGPIPRSLMRRSSSASSAAASGSGDGSPTRRSSARFARSAACSNVPPNPTPTMSGGLGLGPASAIVRVTNSTTPSRTSAGVSMASRLMLSHPAPFARTDSVIRSPGTMRVYTIAGVLSPVFCRVSGPRTTEARR